MKREDKNEDLEGIDLLIIDIDDSFIFHRTVAVANEIFLHTIEGLFGADTTEHKLLTTRDALAKSIKIALTHTHKFRFDISYFSGLICLCAYASVLHFLNMIREIWNFFGGKMSNRAVIRIWGGLVTKMEISSGRYFLSEEVIRRGLYPKMMEVYEKIRKANKGLYVAAISENFSISSREDPIIRLLGIDFMKTNTLFCDKKGRIDGYKIEVGNRYDKKRIAEEVIGKRKAKRVGIIIDDYEDLELLKIKNLRLVVYTPKIRRFIDKKSYDCVEVRII